MRTMRMRPSTGRQSSPVRTTVCQVVTSTCSRWPVLQTKRKHETLESFEVYSMSDKRSFAGRGAADCASPALQREPSSLTGLEWTTAYLPT